MVVSSSWEYLEPKRIRLRDRPELGEQWAKERLIESPQLLQLGDLVLTEEESRLPGAGRLDLLFQDSEAGRMYEVEIQVGSMNSSHILRGIEYWGTVQMMYPEYDHYPVLVAENIAGSRFLKAVRILNTYIPFIVLEMRVLQLNDRFSLELTKVSLEQVETPKRALVDWPEAQNESRTELLRIIEMFAKKAIVTETKAYTGFSRSPGASYFAWLRCQKSKILLELALRESPRVSSFLQEAKLEFRIIVRNKRTRYRIKITADKLELLKPLLIESCNQSTGGNRDEV